MKGLKKIWSNRKQILEGIKNNIFKSAEIEAVAEERMKFCNDCFFLDLEGKDCLVTGTQPCCGKCGCSLKLKLRSLSSQCGDEENPRWLALLSPEEEQALKEEIDYKDPIDE